MDTQEATDLTAIFGEPIHTYTQRQAIEDGYLFPIAEREWREAGIACPVIVTVGVYTGCIEWTPAHDARLPRACQDQSGRLWDVLWMFRTAAQAHRDSSRIDYRLLVVNPETGRRETVTLTAVIGPGDDGQPCVTIMLPGEE